MKSIRILCVVGMALGYGCSTGWANFVGDTVEANYDWPSLGTVLFSSGTAVAPVIFNNVGGFGVGVSPTVTFTATSITFSYPHSFDLHDPSGTTFDGWVFLDLTHSNIIGASLASTNFSGFTASDLSFTSNSVIANQLFDANSTIPAGTFVTINVQFGAVPGPLAGAGLPGLLLVGGGLLGWWRRRKKEGAAAALFAAA